MLPLTLLNAAQGRELDVECKSGRTYRGRMKACDISMGVMLENARCTSEHADVPSAFSELFVRGSSIKYIRVPEQLLTDIVEERAAKREEMFGPRSQWHSRSRTTNQR